MLGVIVHSECSIKEFEDSLISNTYLANIIYVNTVTAGNSIMVVKSAAELGLGDSINGCFFSMIFGWFL